MSIAYQTSNYLPIFNTPLIPFLSPSLTTHYDHQGLLKQIEMIAFPETHCEIVRHFPSSIVQVTVENYSCDSSLYVDSRMLIPAFFSKKQRQFPSACKMISWIVSQIGVRYFYGGNRAQGIGEMALLYPHLDRFHPDLLCQGLDCSGLLYEASLGLTPRNTTDLITYGTLISNHLASYTAVKHLVKPLDIIVWKGHVLIVLDADTVIESRLYQGVVISNFKERYEEICTELSHQGKIFSIRRWHPDFLT